MIYKTRIRQNQAQGGVAVHNQLVVRGKRREQRAHLNLRLGGTIFYPFCFATGCKPLQCDSKVTPRCMHDHKITESETSCLATLIMI